MYAAPADASLPKDVVATLKLIPPLPVEGAPLIFFPPISGKVKTSPAR